MTPTGKYLLIFLQLFVALGWIVGLCWVFIVLLASDDPISTSRVLAYWGAMLLGPIALAAGSLGLVGTSPPRRAVRLLASVGSMGVAIQSLVWVAPTIHESIGRNEIGLAVLAALIVALSLLTAVSAYATTREARATDAGR